MKTIAIHNGEFHADDIFSSAILKLIYPDLKIIRTRDPEEWKKVDARIDVGRKYDHKTKDYDHHQPEFNERRKNGIKYASVGLIWKHYGEKLVSKEAWQIIEEKIIQFIDADDNGISTYEAKQAEPYTIGKIIETLNPKWPNKLDYEKPFQEALLMVIKIMKKEIELTEDTVKARKAIREKLAKTKEKYMILEEYMPYKGVVIDESDILFVIYPDSNREGAWITKGIEKEKGKFGVRKKFPKEWAGLVNENLTKATGVPGSIFCHVDRFIAVADSKEGAIKLTKLALENDSS